MIPLAERSGKCEIRPNSYVHKIEVDERGRGPPLSTSTKRKKRPILQKAESCHSLREWRGNARLAPAFRLKQISGWPWPIPAVTSAKI